MRKRFSRLLIFCLTAFPSPQAHAGDAPALAVQVCNFSRADGKIVAQAADIARRIFRDASIETVWLTAAIPASPGQSDPSALRVQIFSGRPKRSDIRDAFGAAFTDTSQEKSFLADVFFGNIEEVATTRTDEATLLGYVMAHEVGHLLGVAHTPETVMAESWTGRDIPRMHAGRVRFNPSQGERLRNAVALRQRARQK
jgi:hypothetical protein